MKNLKDVINSENKNQNKCVINKYIRVTAQNPDNGVKIITIIIPRSNQEHVKIKAIIEPNVKLRDILNELNLPIGPLYHQIYRPMKKEMIRDNNVDLFSLLDMDETIEILPMSMV